MSECLGSSKRDSCHLRTDYRQFYVEVSAVVKGTTKWEGETEELVCVMVALRKEESQSWFLVLITTEDCGE